MANIAATSSINLASPVRGITPARNRESQSTTEALQELTRAAHRAISSAESVATTVSPVAGVSAGLAAALWNLDSGASATSTPAPEMTAAAQPEAASSLETEVLKALAQALGVDDAA